MENWIPTTERLPECDEKYGVSKIVWCCDARGRMGFGIFTNNKGRFFHEGWFIGGNIGRDGVSITHWMPLPEPPKN